MANFIVYLFYSITLQTLTLYIWQKGETKSTHYLAVISYIRQCDPILQVKTLRD